MRFRSSYYVFFSVFLQEVHEILKDYELKYCFVDRNKGTGRRTEDGPDVPESGLGQRKTCVHRCQNSKPPKISSVLPPTD